MRPDAEPADLFPKVLGYDISTRLTLQLNSTNNPAMLDEDYHIEGVEHSWAASEDLWQTKWQLWDINRYRAFNALHDGYLYNRSLYSYADCREAAESHYTPFNDHGTTMVGQRRVAVPAWDIMRGLLELDTSELLTDDNVLEAYILVYLQEAYADVAWSLTLVDNNSVENPLEKADYGALLVPTDSRGALGVSAPPGWRVIVLNSAGIAAIAKEGTTRFGLRNSNDIGGSEPGAGDNEYVIMGGAGWLHAPKLVVRLL